MRNLPADMRRVRSGVRYRQYDQMGGDFFRKGERYDNYVVTKTGYADDIAVPPRLFARWKKRGSRYDEKIT